MPEVTAVIINDQTAVDQQIDVPSELAENGKEVFKAGVSMILISISELSNPPIAVTLNRGHKLLSIAFSIAISATLVIGFLLLVLSVVLQWAPRLAPVAEKLIYSGKVLVKVTLGFGSSLVLMVASSSWLVLFLVFIGSLYM